MKRILLSLFILCVTVLSAQSQNLNYTLSDDSLVNEMASIKRVYYAARTETKPKIDGKLDDECWQKTGTWDGNFVQQQPHQAAKPSQQTEIKILYDDKYLYFAIICHDDEPEKMSPILGRRDENNGDMAGIALDSYHDKQTAFEFNLTAAGQKVDL
ncbi:MAG TPA: carbohydrate binding family 9 domain-containing protein, partial [Draconibacterium sp.]|nr:carbohydrate binding family 9 domain-containing protein [Draconibacterium sp.]